MILFIDDEEERMEPYMDVCGFENLRAELVRDPLEGLRFVESHAAEIKVLVLDLMMPTGEYFDRPEAQVGLRTGIELFKEVRKAHPRIPVLFFTNSNDTAAAAIIKQGEQLVYFEAKQHVLPEELPSKLRAIMQGTRQGRASS